MVYFFRFTVYSAFESVLNAPIVSYNIDIMIAVVSRVSDDYHGWLQSAAGSDVS